MARAAAAALLLLAGPANALSMVGQGRPPLDAPLQSEGEDQQDSSICECLDWQDVYRYTHASKVGCGAGNELQMHANLSALEERSAALVQDQICNAFYKRIPTALCTNMEFSSNPETYEVAQWCYVKSDCKQLNGGKQVHQDLSWKQCVPGSDDMFKDRDLKELGSIAKAADVDLGLLLRMAYPTWPGDTWSSVVEFFGAGGGHSLPADRRARLASLIKSGKPMVFDSNPRSDNNAWEMLQWQHGIGVTVGPKAYKVVRKDRPNDRSGNLMTMAPAAGGAAALECVHGC